MEIMLNGKFLIIGSLAISLLLVIPLKGESRLGANGVSLNGTNLNANSIAPTASEGVLRVEGGQLVIETSPMAR
jgi:hypothetical protein